MSKMLAIAIFGLGFALNVAAAEPPATNAVLTDMKGPASINQGEEFVPATEGMRLKPGDRLMVPEDSEAVITYDDECRQEVDESTIVTVQEKSSCAGGALVEQGLNPAGGRVIGSAAPGVGPGNVAGGLIVAGWAAIGYCWIEGCFGDEDDDDTVSP